MKKIIVSSSKETKEFAKKFAQNFQGGVIALSGPLGAGKTTFTQGFAEGLKIKDKIISPTFVLIRQHQVPLSKGQSASGRKTLYHIDLYRLDNPNDLKNIGLEDMLKTKDDYVLIEWAEKAKPLLPKSTTWINFQINNINKRTLEITDNKT